MTQSTAHKSFRPGSRVRRLQLGVGLVELMVALTLGLIVLSAVVNLTIGSRKTYRVNEDQARLQETGRFALELIGKSLRQAGYADIPLVPITSQKTNCGCVPLQGVNGVGGAPDSVTVQFDAGEDEYDTQSGPTQNTWIGRDCTGGKVSHGNLITNTFSLSGTDFSCQGNAGGTQPLLNDIEDLQIEYGMDTDGDQSADRYMAAPINWNQVISARVCVLVRSPRQSIVEPTYRYLDCANAATLTPADRRLRRAFTATFNLRPRISDLP